MMWLESESRLSKLKYRIADQSINSGGEAKRCDFWDCHTPCCTHTPCCIVTLTHAKVCCTIREWEGSQHYTRLPAPLLGPG